MTSVRMIIFTYDRTFEGLLTALFDAYVRKSFPHALLHEAEPLPLFYDEVHRVITDLGKAERVWKALCRKLPGRNATLLTYCWLSETPEAPMLLLRYMKKVVDSPVPIHTDFADPTILSVTQLGRKVSGERYRILQFMRFQKLADGTYFGIMEPLYDVIPLTIGHFRDRFADQPWIIYDAKRKYGYSYNGTHVDEITFTHASQGALRTGKVDENLLDKNEKLYQALWKNYFDSICIRERLNPVKHKKDMPVRYWKFLTEKNEG